MEDEHGSDVAHNTPEPETDTPDTPEDLTDTEPEDLELEEEKLTDKAQGYVSRKIAKLKEEGFPPDQAAAIAFSMARKRGFDVNDNPNEAEIQEDTEPKTRLTSFQDHTVDEEASTRDSRRNGPPDAVADKADRPLDSGYITDAVATYAEELKNDVDTEEDLEVAVEMRQVARSMRSQFPNMGDVHIEQAYDIADEQGIEDKEILQKVKDEIKYIWMQV